MGLLKDDQVVSRVFRTFGWAERHPAVGPQPGRGQVAPVGERPDDARAPPDLAQEPLERVVGADPPPVLLGECIVGQGLLDPRFRELGGSGQAQAAQLAALWSVILRNSARRSRITPCWLGGSKVAYQFFQIRHRSQ